MALSIRSDSQSNQVTSEASDKKSFFKPFKLDEDLSENLISFEVEQKKFLHDQTLGSSIKLDGSDVIRFSVRADESDRSNSNGKIKRYEERLANSESSTHEVTILDNNFYLKKLENLLDSDVMRVFEPTSSRFIDIIHCFGDDSVCLQDDSSLGISEDTSKNQEQDMDTEGTLSALCEVVLQLDKIVYTVGKLSGSSTDDSVLQKCMDKIAKLLDTSPNNTLPFLLRSNKLLVTQPDIHFVEGKGNCLASVLILQTVTQLPNQLLKSLYFEVECEGLPEDETRSLKVSYTFLLVYHMTILLLRRLFEKCLELNCSKGQVLSALEGFIWNAIEMDKSDLIIRLDDVFWRWNKGGQWIGNTEVKSWCLDLIKKTELQFNEECNACSDEDEKMNISDKYNLAKLFINEFNDVLFSVREDVLQETVASKNYSDLLTRFANSLETRLTGQSPINIAYNSYQSPLHQEDAMERESVISGEQSTAVIDPRDPEVQRNGNGIEVGIEARSTLSQREVLECDTLVYNGSVYFQARNRPSGWLAHLANVPENSCRYKIWVKLQKWKQSYRRWSHKRTDDSRVQLSEPEIRPLNQNGRPFLGEYLNTTYSDMVPQKPVRFQNLREKKKRFMFKFFGDDS